MNERERLVELLFNIPPMNINIGGRRNGKRLMTMQHLADHLLANGVIVPPCKVGDMVYRVYRESNIIVEESVISVGVDKEGIFIETSAAMYYELHFNWLLYFTQAEAEKALAERGKR